MMMMMMMMMVTSCDITRTHDGISSHAFNRQDQCSQIQEVIKFSRWDSDQFRAKSKGKGDQIDITELNTDTKSENNLVIAVTGWCWRLGGMTLNKEMNE